jgi:hypothetical protein
VQLTKQRPSRTGLLSSALKVGGQFVDGLLKGLPFWRALYGSGQEQAFRALIKEVQKGTKQLQVRKRGGDIHLYVRAAHRVTLYQGRDLCLGGCHLVGMRRLRELGLLEVALVERQPFTHPVQQA